MAIDFGKLKIQLKINSDLESPFATVQNANDNYSELTESVNALVDTLEIVNDKVDGITTTQLTTLINSILVSRVKQYIIPVTLQVNSSVVDPDGTTITRTGLTTYTISTTYQVSNRQVLSIDNTYFGYSFGLVNNQLNLTFSSVVISDKILVLS